MSDRARCTDRELPTAWQRKICAGGASPHHNGPGCLVGVDHLPGVDGAGSVSPTEALEAAKISGAQLDWKHNKTGIQPRHGRDMSTETYRRRCYTSPAATKSKKTARP